MASSLLFAVVTLGLVCVTSGQIHKGTGKCPARILKDQKFYPRNCKECTCQTDSWTCIGCPASETKFNWPMCYRNSRGSKPGSVLCAGDPGYKVEGIFREPSIRPRPPPPPPPQRVTVIHVEHKKPKNKFKIKTGNIFKTKHTKSKHRKF
ncbi:hypothetical protein BgiBS90_011762 [Biomphalaria glabrata]|nr:hypothetical protein BgiBS90_011762 [Biomphalaria glabrata]